MTRSSMSIRLYYSKVTLVNQIITTWISFHEWKKMTSDNFKPYFLPQILIKMLIQGQFWIMLILRKHSQHVEIDQVLSELFEIKDKW